MTTSDLGAPPRDLVASAAPAARAEAEAASLDGGIAALRDLVSGEEAGLD